MVVDKCFTELIPWYDVLFIYVFPRLTIRCLCNLRGVSRSLNECVGSYWRVCTDYNFSQLGHRFNVAAFYSVTDDNAAIQSLTMCNTNDWLTDAILQPVLVRSVQLQKIDLSHCTRLSDSSLTLLASCSQLRGLCLKECKWVGSKALATVAHGCPHLECVDVIGCWNVNDEAVIALASSCSRMKFLSLAKIYSLTDRCISFVAKHCGYLQHVDIRGCWRVSDDSIRCLGEYCSALTGLEVRDCRNVTEVSLARLRAKGIKMDIPKRQYRIEPQFMHYLHNLKLQV